MIWVAFFTGLGIGVFVGVFALCLCQMARGGIYVYPPSRDESPRPVITPNPRPRVAKR